jgi:hypothetical protein
MGSEVFEPVHTPLTPKLPRGGIVQGLEKKFDSDMGSSRRWSQWRLYQLTRL